MINDSDHMNCHSDIDGDLSECKDIDASHEDDWDYDFKKDLECESGSQTTSTPKSNLEEVIDLVIQDAIDYANSPEDKRILPILTRKPAKGKGKSVSSTNSSANHAFSNAQSSQQQVSASNSAGLLLSANINNPSQFHPLMQQNLTHNMQHMLQLAATGKGALQLSGANTTASTIQHINNASQPQQQITNAMMGFSAAQLPNMIMPSYNTTLSSNYTQQASNSQYPLPVSLSQIQLAQQQQSQLMLNNNQNSFTDLSTTSNNQQQNLNFGVGGISSANVQLMQSSYGNFGSNSSIAVSPYQMTGMIQGFAPQTVTDNSLSHQNETQTSIANLSTNPTSASCFLSSKTNSNSALTNNSASSNPNSSSSASLYQANVFDLHQTQLYAQHRLLQAQQQHQQQQSSSSSSNSASIFPDYAAVMARYGAYH